MKITLEYIEDALRTGTLWARMGNGNLWRVRRNGQTKLWKTRPSDFSVPIKAGLKSCARITQDSELSEEGDGRLIIDRV